MKRREFIISCVAGVAWKPLIAVAQQGRMPIIGFLNPNTPDAYPEAIAAFLAGLRSNGYVDGKTVTVVYRWADGHNDRVPGLVAELLGLPVNVIAATGGGATALAAKAATTTIPIVFNSADDPVRAGLVASLDRPGGNLTGVSRLSVELMPKRLELLHEIAPDAAPIAYLVESNSTVATDQVAQRAAKALGIELRVVRVTRDTNLQQAFASLNSNGVKALLIGSGAYFNSRSKELGELCFRFKLPAIYQRREFVAAGGLASYGPSLADAYRVVGDYTGRVLKGMRPADLPIQQQTKVEFIINLKTAKALGLAVSLPLLGRADEVIE